MFNSCGKHQKDQLCSFRIPFFLSDRPFASLLLLGSFRWSVVGRCFAHRLSPFLRHYGRPPRWNEAKVMTSWLRAIPETNGHFSLSPVVVLLLLLFPNALMLLSREIFSRRLNFFTPLAFRNDVKAFARSLVRSASPLSVAADADFVVVIVTVEQSNENSSFWPLPLSLLSSSLLVSFPPGSGTKEGNGMRSQGRRRGRTDTAPLRIQDQSTACF